jgi:hypothetical protein
MYTFSAKSTPQPHIFGQLLKIEKTNTFLRCSNPRQKLDVSPYLVPPTIAEKTSYSFPHTTPIRSSPQALIGSLY